MIKKLEKNVLKETKGGNLYYRGSKFLIKGEKLRYNNLQTTNNCYKSGRKFCPIQPVYP
ncbi:MULTISPECIES: hypothetical protein [Aerococcus]|uniref:hypothetical protein n=1 Tax=Aerococcus TaxID=1375 RepID=UPI00143A9352|nr:MULTISPECIES: hypothetical protein [Aerococcus]MDK6369273.1 hypothetical protein [Aerococcus sp. UMB9870]MDK6679097.1 hypothetical protein [Aerococcus sp. UMB8608]MDK6687004.1 hypothetical protein [Aerococcus sp. UMB8623]MDK6941245.1 hypothetical protein [Aerococcus sp. UMB8487]